MRSKLFLLLLTAAILTLPDNTSAQGVYQNSSVYSSIGMGIPIDFRSSAGAGMGMTGVALWNFNAANNSNPAIWGGSFFTMATAGLSMKTFTASDNFGEDRNTMINFNQIQLVLPVWREVIGVSASLQPVTESRYTFFQEGSIIRPAGDSLNYLIDRRGDGGINRMEIGIGARISNWLLVGYAPSLVFGYYENNNTTFFDRSGYSDINYKVGTRHIGFGHRVGLLASHYGLFRNNDRITFGSTFTFPVQLTSRRNMTTEVITGNPPRRRTIDLFPEEHYGDGQVEIPLELNSGLTYNLTPYFLLAGELLFQNWSEFNNFEGEKEAILIDRTKYSLGLQYDARRRGQSGFLNSFVYRLGASFDDGHLRLNDANIETVLFTAGLGIPSPYFGSTIDLSVDYGIRGTKSNDLVQERIFSIRASFNLSEIMFLQRRLQ